MDGRDWESKKESDGEQRDMHYEIKMRQGIFFFFLFLSFLGGE